ncbi:MAG: outer membrane lipoprotein carrier protein LolA [Saprospiraceae bacterium]
MKYILFITILFGSFVSGAWAQTMTSVDENDPKARAILQKIDSQFKKSNSLEIPFTLTFEIPGKPAHTEKGIYYETGNKYKIQTTSQDIYCNGATNWVYIKNRKEVQITDFEPNAKSDFLSPKQLLKGYANGDYIYAITEEKVHKGRSEVEIEFKPVKKGSSYTKIKLNIDKTKNNLLSLRVFNRDGSRQTLTLGNVISNNSYDASFFNFDPKTVAGIRIEDLRID